MRMTLAAFRASGRDVADLGDEHPGLDLEGTPGRIYGPASGPYIERHGDEWHLTLGNAQWVGPHGNLPKLERLLWGWARSERIV